MINENEENKKFGFVNLWRSLTKWEWYTEVNTCKLFIHLLLCANHKKNEWRGITINRGSLITSYAHLAFETGLSEQNVRTALKNLKSTNEITHEVTPRYSIITVNNYDFYQPTNTQTNIQITGNQHSPNTVLTTNNNDNNDNNDNNNIIRDKKNKNFIIPSLEEIKNYCIERNNNIDPNKFFDHYQSNGWFVGKNKMKDWKAAVRNWERNKFSTNPITEKQQVDEEYNYGIG